MPRWFLSYNSQDLALMQGLEAALRRKDSGAKIFFAPTSLRAGGFWLPELAKGIAEATAFVLLVGQKADMGRDSFPARNFCGRCFRRDGRRTGHAKNVAKPRD